MTRVKKWYSVRYHERWCFQSAKACRKLREGLVKVEGDKGGGLLLTVTLYEAKKGGGKGQMLGMDHLDIRKMKECRVKHIRKLVNQGKWKVDIDKDDELSKDEEPDSSDDECEYE
ncbi:unnamed protein product [Vitrella brassicaformis CCMP3155]|uniref:Uncharacterized protein n=1 Tax=Vitrella brassicaformis (strain CCMP3155) TaxID=1169540 RepID=A0A0G4FFR4_VITBC|nr:unnamed protein product [Vitrella brassicaformis CCMP3155]|eukprot:CEM11714.1 unnamed protein product [Vitrella brassicaformis CCMP3155]